MRCGRRERRVLRGQAHSSVATTLIYSISVVLFPKYNLTYSQVNAQDKHVGSSACLLVFGFFAFAVIHVLVRERDFPPR